MEPTSSLHWVCDLVDTMQMVHPPPESSTATTPFQQGFDPTSQRYRKNNGASGREWIQLLHDTRDIFSVQAQATQASELDIAPVGVDSDSDIGDADAILAER